MNLLQNFKFNIKYKEFYIKIHKIKFDFLIGLNPR
jgi:hypothetical protein